MEILSELVNTAREKMLDADARLSDLLTELEKSKNKVNEIKADYRRLMEWSAMYDTSPIEVKKMIACQLFSRIEIGKGYRIHAELAVTYRQFVEEWGGEYAVH